MRSSPALTKRSREETHRAGFGHPTAATMRARSRNLFALEICEGMMDLVAAFFDLPGKELRREGKTEQVSARARQIAMYVTHVTFGLSMKEVGHGFGRDRTTVLHACHLVEDLRDEIDFDRVVQTIERIARAVFAVRMEHVHG